MKTRKPTGGSCAETRSNNGHGSWQSLSAWVSAQPAPTCHCLSFLSLPSLPPPALPPHFPLSISLSSHSSSFGSPPPRHPPTIPPPLFLSARIFRPLFPLYNTPSPPPPMRLLPPPPPLPLHSPSFSLRGCSSRCTLTARGYCVWKCSCWTRRPLQSTVQRLEHLCLRLGTFDLQLTLQTCHRG